MGTAQTIACLLGDIKMALDKASDEAGYTPDITEVNVSVEAVADMGDLVRASFKTLVSSRFLDEQDAATSEVRPKPKGKRQT